MDSNKKSRYQHPLGWTGKNKLKRRILFAALFEKHYDFIVARVTEYTRIANGCWYWRDGKTKPCMAIGKHHFPVSLVAWTLANNAIPIRPNMCHMCDNELCVNPHHLFPGTQKENMQDCVIKGRSKSMGCRLTGFEHPNNILTKANISYARRAYSAGTEMQTIADILGVSRQLIWRRVKDLVIGYGPHRQKRKKKEL